MGMCVCVAESVYISVTCAGPSSLCDSDPPAVDSTLFPLLSATFLVYDKTKNELTRQRIKFIL